MADDPATIAREEAIDIVDRHTRLGGTGQPRSAAAAVDALLAWGWTPPPSPSTSSVIPGEGPWSAHWSGCPLYFIVNWTGDNQPLERCYCGPQSQDAGNDSRRAS